MPIASSGFSCLMRDGIFNDWAEGNRAQVKETGSR